MSLPYSNPTSRRTERRLDLIGKTFSRWTFIGHGRLPNGQAGYLCRCSCGTERVTVPSTVVKGKSKSCGCWNLEQAHKRKNVTHGHHGTRIYTSWSGMKERCTSERRRDWKDYGGRGITFCKRWAKFENFLADMGEMPEGTTLDRKNVNGNYCKRNCRWATSDEQANNRTDNRWLSAFGKTMTMKQWSRDARCAVSYVTMKKRAQAGWPDEQIIAAPLHSRISA